jgi:hypothetical protein
VYVKPVPHHRVHGNPPKSPASRMHAPAPGSKEEPAIQKRAPRISPSVVGQSRHGRSELRRASCTALRPWQFATCSGQGTACGARDGAVNLTLVITVAGSTNGTQRSPVCPHPETR